MASDCTKKIVENQMNKRIRSGIGYNTCPPPYRGIPCPSGSDLAETGSHEIVNRSLVEPIEPNESVKNETKSISIKENRVGQISSKKVEIKAEVKTVLKTVESCENCNNKPRGSQRNWNNLKSQQLGDNFVMYNKACYYCGSFNHLQAYCNNWVSGSTSRSKTNKTNPRKGL